MAIFKKHKYKYCPVCGNQLRIEDSYCVKCGYSFVERQKKKSKIKWKNILVVIVILLAAYVGFRFYNQKPLIPISVSDALNFTK